FLLLHLLGIRFVHMGNAVQMVLDHLLWSQVGRFFQGRYLFVCRHKVCVRCCRWIPDHLTKHSGRAADGASKGAAGCCFCINLLTLNGGIQSATVIFSIYAECPEAHCRKMVGRTGFEPVTNWLKANCSTN